MEERGRPRRVVVALGGNAISSPDDEGTVEQDFANLERSLESIMALVEEGYQVTVTHGNGPQVGNQMIRVEQSLGKAPDLPLDVMVADIQGGLGYMMERVLRDKLTARGLDRQVCCLVTLVEVVDDGSAEEPSKFVGPVMTQERAFAGRDEEGWVVKEDKARKGWRRVVASPEPKTVLEAPLIEQLTAAGTIVICTGGGGIPVVRRDGRLEGVSGVIDKDRSSALLARQIGAAELYVLTAVEKVALNFQTPEEELVETLRVSDARRHLAEGQFPAGSMGPKIDAACRFVEGGGTRSLITDIFCLTEALAGETGTWIVPG